MAGSRVHSRPVFAGKGAVTLGLHVPSAATFAGDLRSAYAEQGACRWRLRVSTVGGDEEESSTESESETEGGLCAQLERYCAPDACTCGPHAHVRLRSIRADNRAGAKDFAWIPWKFYTGVGNAKFAIGRELLEPARGYVEVGVPPPPAAADGRRAKAAGADVYDPASSRPCACDDWFCIDDESDSFDQCPRVPTRDTAFLLLYMHAERCHRRNRLADGSAACASPTCAVMRRLVEHCAKCDMALGACEHDNCDYARSAMEHVRRKSEAWCDCDMCHVTGNGDFMRLLALPKRPEPELDTALVQTDDCGQWGSRKAKRNVTSSGAQTESPMEQELANMRDKAESAQKAAAIERELVKQLRKKLKQTEADTKRLLAAAEQQTAEHNAQLERLHVQLAQSNAELAERSDQLQRVTNEWRPPVHTADAAAQAGVLRGDKETQTAAEQRVRHVPAMPVPKPMPVLQPPPPPPVFSSYAASTSPPATSHQQQEHSTAPAPVPFAIATVTLAPGVGRGRRAFDRMPPPPARSTAGVAAAASAAAQWAQPQGSRCAQGPPASSNSHCGGRHGADGAQLPASPQHVSAAPTAAATVLGRVTDELRTTLPTATPLQCRIAVKRAHESLSGQRGITRKALVNAAVHCANQMAHEECLICMRVAHNTQHCAHCFQAYCAECIASWHGRQTAGEPTCAHCQRPWAWA